MRISDYFYTEGETAKVLGVNRATIWRWIKEDKFDTQKIGGYKGIVLIPKWEVELLKMRKQPKANNTDENAVLRKYPLRIFSKKFQKGGVVVSTNSMTP